MRMRRGNETRQPDNPLQYGKPKTVVHVCCGRPVAVIKETMGDAAADVAAVRYSLTPGDSFAGTFGNNDDVDLVRVAPVADTLYDIGLTGADGMATALPDAAGNVIMGKPWRTA